MPGRRAEGETASIDVVVKVKRGEVASWSRGEIRIEPDGRRLRTGDRGGTLDLGGDRVPVNWDAGSNQVGELVGLLAARQQRDLEVQQDRLELEQVAALAQASHDEIVRCRRQPRGRSRRARLARGPGAPACASA